MQSGDYTHILRGFAQDLAQSLEPVLERAMAKGMYDAYATLQMLTVPQAPTVALVTAQAQAIHKEHHNRNVNVDHCDDEVCRAFVTWCQEWDIEVEFPEPVLAPGSFRVPAPERPKCGIPLRDSLTLECTLEPGHVDDGWHYCNGQAANGALQGPWPPMPERIQRILDLYHGRAT